MTQVDIAALSPQVVWQHFQTLCTIPRPSKHEQQLREFLQNWAESRNLETYVDEVGNLIIRKNATLGKEHVSGVILQGHL
ncbi:aminoacyl-histidine dipeptidase, partial [Acinetobacter baumannii]